MPDDDLSGPYHEAIRRGFAFAHEGGRRCGPVHFLVGISEGTGCAAAALDPGAGRSLREIVAAAGELGDRAGYLHLQAQEAARSFAAASGHAPAAEHLLIALIDQATPEVLQALNLAGLDNATVRATALAGIGMDADMPPIAMPALAPAGSLDRPPLPVADLDQRAWTVLCWRQEHLPVDRVRSRDSAEALRHLEWQAAWRLGEELRLDEDQRFSLVHHHVAAVERHVSPARPDLGRRRPSRGRYARLIMRHRFLRRRIGFTVGWGVWFGNRRVNVRDRWFELTTLHNYRGQPEPDRHS